jgi:hypothetical protein
MYHVGEKCHVCDHVFAQGEPRAFGCGALDGKTICDSCLEKQAILGPEYTQAELDRMTHEYKEAERRRRA